MLAGCVPQLGARNVNTESQSASDLNQPKGDAQQRLCIDLLHKLRALCQTGLAGSTAPGTFDCLDARVRLKQRCY